MDRQLADLQMIYEIAYEQFLRYISTKCNYLKSSDYPQDGLHKIEYPEIPYITLSCRMEGKCSNRHCLSAFGDYGPPDNTESKDYYYETNTVEAK